MVDHSTWKNVVEQTPRTYHISARKPAHDLERAANHHRNVRHSKWRIEAVRKVKPIINDKAFGMKFII